MSLKSLADAKASPVFFALFKTKFSQFRTIMKIWTSSEQPYHSDVCQHKLMIKYTKHTLKKVEDLFDKIKYTIRYERGNFQSGYCIVENRRIAVINKFYDAEARINCLIEILGNVEVDIETLEDKEKSLYRQLTEVFEAKAENPEAEKTETPLTEENPEAETPQVTPEN